MPETAGGCHGGVGARVCRAGALETGPAPGAVHLGISARFFDQPQHGICQRTGIIAGDDIADVNPLNSPSDSCKATVELPRAKAFSWFDFQGEDNQSPDYSDEIRYFFAGIEVDPFAGRVKIGQTRVLPALNPCQVRVIWKLPGGSAGTI
jgi:hypothetical protein